jgi:DNA-directed RNA polymerase subunit alpha
MIQLSSLKYPNIKTTLKETGDKTYQFLVEPLLPGYGHTLGNSIRRVLLSSVPGTAVTKVRISGVTHEYQGVDGVVEDVLNILLNLKQLRTQILTDDDTLTFKLEKHKAGDILAKDFDAGKAGKVVNGDLYICHLSEDKEFTIEVEVSKGIGYLSTDQIDFSGNLDPQNLLVDATFSPVSNVAFSVDKVRIGERTDFDKLTIDFTTDGSVDGDEVMEYSLGIINQMYQQLQSGFSTPENAKTTTKTKAATKPKNDLDLDEAIVAILEKNGINSKAELEARKDEVADFAGITSKQLKAIDKFLA